MLKSEKFKKPFIYKCPACHNVQKVFFSNMHSAEIAAFFNCGHFFNIDNYEIDTKEGCLTKIFFTNKDIREETKVEFNKKYRQINSQEQLKEIKKLLQLSDADEIVNKIKATCEEKKILDSANLTIGHRTITVNQQGKEDIYLKVSMPGSIAGISLNTEEISGLIAILTEMLEIMS